MTKSVYKQTFVPKNE